MRYVFCVQGFYRLRIQAAFLPFFIRYASTAASLAMPAGL
jgi:hypothetical protein